MSGNKQLIIDRAAGIHPARFYLTVAWSAPREEGSWWVMLTQERREATVWTIDSVPHGEPFQVTISTKIGSTRPVYLTAIGNSETGAVTCLEEQGHAVIVDTVNEEHARWFQHYSVTETEGQIFCLAQGPAQGCALTGLCFPGMNLLHDGPRDWRSVPDRHGVMVRSTSTTPVPDCHVLWNLLPQKREVSG